MTSPSDDVRAGSLAYHEQGRAGKLEIRATKPLANQRDLALAYSPGVAAVSPTDQECWPSGQALQQLLIPEIPPG